MNHYKIIDKLARTPIGEPQLSLWAGHNFPTTMDAIAALHLNKGDGVELSMVPAKMRIYIDAGCIALQKRRTKETLLGNMPLPLWENIEPILVETSMFLDEPEFHRSAD